MITIDPAPNSKNHGLSNSSLIRFLNRARAAVRVKGAVDVLLSDDTTLRQLNKNFRGKNKATDVLSFPAPAAFAGNHAGDLAISLDTAARQAATYGHTLHDEVKILLLHGLLHLSGQDHETDNGEMAILEATLRRELHLPNTLIERAKALAPEKPRSTTKKPSATTRKPSSRSTGRTSSRSKRGSK